MNPTTKSDEEQVRDISGGNLIDNIPNIPPSEVRPFRFDFTGRGQQRSD